jgi:CARDB
MVITQKYRFIADLLTAWEANGYAMGVDQQLKIRELLQKIPDDCTISELKTLLSPIFAHNAKQQEEFYDLFTKLEPQQNQTQTDPDIQTQAPTSPTSDIPNPTSKDWLRNRLRWRVTFVIGILLVLLFVFFDKIINLIIKPNTIPERYVRTELIYNPKKPDIRTFRFDFDTPSVKNIKMVSLNAKMQGVTTVVTNLLGKIPYFTAQARPMSAETQILVDTLTFLFEYADNTKERVHYEFTIHNSGAPQRVTTKQSTLALKPYNHTPDTATLRPQEVMQFSLLNGGWSWMKTGLWALLGSAIWGIAYWRRRKEQKDLAARRDNKTKPPYSWQIKIEGIENTIQLNDVFFRTANDMRRRSEMDIRRLDMPRTIQGTIKKAGMPQFSYRQPTQTNEYLVLIDQAAAQSHRARLFDFLMRRWQQQEVLVERFFFNGDIRLCWNEKHKRGLSIAELQQQFPTHRLIVVSHGFWLLKTMVVEWDEWTAGLLDNWRYKVLLTPRMPSEWDARETVLSKKFRILPAILRGVGDLAETLDAIEIPDFKRWQELDLDEAQPIRLPRKLSAETLMIFLESHFIVYQQGGKRDDRLLQWMAACAVSPVIHWDLTLVFGKLISDNSPESDSLVTLDSIFQLTRLSWFNEALMSDEVRRPLLDWLEKTHPSVLAQVRAKWAEILTTNKPPEDSIAFDDYSLAVTINALNQKPTPHEKRKLNEELERTLANEPRQDFLVLDYLAAQRTPLDAFVPKRFLNYFRDPERRIPTLRAWVWQIPLWLVGGLLFFGFNYAPNCTEGVAMTRTRMACIKNDQDKLTLLEYAICDVLDKNYWRVSDVKADSVLAWAYFSPSRNAYADVNSAPQRVDEELLASAQNMIRTNNLDSISFYQNLKIAYANAAIRFTNKSYKDSACLFVQLCANLQTKDSVLTADELTYFNQLCNTQNAQSNKATILPPKPNRIPVQNAQPQTNTAQNPPLVQQTTTDAYKKDTVQKQATKLADILSLSISGLQKDIATIGESLNINYALSNDGKEVMENVVLRFMLNNTLLSTTKLDPIPVGETKRGAGNVTIPKDVKMGQQTINIVAEWQGQTLNSNNKTIDINPTKGTTKN